MSVIDNDRTVRIEREPDPARPPLQVTWRINDEGEWIADISFGGVNPFRATELMASVIDAMLTECKRYDVVRAEALHAIEWHLHQVGGPMDVIATYFEKRAELVPCSRCHEPGDFAELEQNSGVCARCMLDADA